MISAGSACGDGLYCNGWEWCHVTSDCQPGTSVDCDDGVGCTVDSCNEGTESCDNLPSDASCLDDGLFCNGTEFCDSVNDCESTGDPCDPSETCDEENDECDATGDPCDTETEACNETTDICDPLGDDDDDQ